MLLVVSVSGRFFGSVVWRSQFCPLAVRHVPVKFWAEHFWFIDHVAWPFFNLVLIGVSGNATEGGGAISAPSQVISGTNPCETDEVVFERVSSRRA